MADFDLILRGGQVYDGTGGEPSAADVAAKDGVIVAVGTVARTSGRPVSFTFMQSPKGEGDWREMVKRLKAAKQEGLEVRGQIIPRPTGALLGHRTVDAPILLQSQLPGDRTPFAGGKVARMRDPEFRKKLIAEEPSDPQEFFIYVISDLDSMFVLGSPPNYNPHPQDSIGARARAMGVDPKELISDAMLHREGHEVSYRRLGNSNGERFESSGRNLVKNDRTFPALGDGGAHCSMICDTAYTTYFTYWVRDAKPDMKVDLSYAIRKLTCEPAHAVGLDDRGLMLSAY